MADLEQLKILKQGIEAWNEWRDKNNRIRPDLREADLLRAHLNAVNFSRANLKGANLRAAKLIGAYLSDADLRGADLRVADLCSAVLNGANLRGAYLFGATLSCAYLNGADLSGADLSRSNLVLAHLTGANFSGADLSKASLTSLNLTGSNLTGADLSEANLSEANLTGVNLSIANLTGATLNKANLTGADLSGANLTQASLVKTNFNKANLTDCRIYGISAWDLVLDKTVQTGLIITKEGDQSVTVNDIEVAQFIYYILENKKIRRVINALTSKAVLILGRFTKKRIEILHALRDKLSEMDYLPIIFDFEKPTDRDFTETVLTLACLSKFVIIDLTDPSSSPHESAITIPNLKIPFLPIIQEGQREYAMFRNFKNYQWLCEGKTYRNKNDLIQNIKKLTDAAETKYLDIRDEKDNSSSDFTPL